MTDTSMRTVAELQSLGRPPQSLTNADYSASAHPES
jgi:hypothetical protein